MQPDRHDLTRIIFAGLGHIDEWRLGDRIKAAMKGFPRQYVEHLLDDYGMVFVDVAIDHRTGAPVCHEVNGPNGVGSDALTGESSLRARNEVGQVLRRLRELNLLAPSGRVKQPVVTLHAHQHWKAFRTGCEFYTRVDDFARLLADDLSDVRVTRRVAGEPLGREGLAVVVGDVPSVTAQLEIDRRSRRLVYQGRPVIFAGNPNLAIELIRAGKLENRDERAWPFDPRVFHGWRLLRAVHDKALQQQLFTGLGMAPLRYFEATTHAEALRRAKEFFAHGPVVLKPNGTSGGTGVRVVTPGMSDAEIMIQIEAIVGDCVAKYGENVEAAIYPLRGFEFVRSTGYPLDGKEHLWDLRIAVLFEPGLAQAFPVSMRVTPKPFDPATFHLDRDQWVSNVSGRTEYLLKSGMDEEALAAVGMTDALLEQVFEASVRWVAKAWDCSVRDGGQGGNVYEDECEREDLLFYPPRKFCA